MYGTASGSVGFGGMAGVLAYTGADPFPAIAFAVFAIIVGSLLTARKFLLNRQRRTS